MAWLWNLPGVIEKNDPSIIRSALHHVVPTFHEPEVLNETQEREVYIPEQQPAKVD